MGELEYLEALKLGKKEQKNCLQHGRSPYLPVLDEILTHQEIQTEQPLGLVNIPLEHVVGTSTRGRTYAFAANFMPILEERSEFAYKWTNLAEAQVTEGIRDPIIAYEFMNRFYVVEGNKRVSVLKYFKADSIPAIVTRKIPVYSEDEDIKLYYEFMKFYEITGLNTVEFSRLGAAEQMIQHIDAENNWDEQAQEDFDRVLFHFTKHFCAKNGHKLSITVGDALVAFFNVYGYEAVKEMSSKEIEEGIGKCWNEIVVLTEKENVDIVMDPKEVEGREKWNPLSFILPQSTKKITVAFLYPKSKDESDWTYTHELGRMYLEETFPEKIETIYVDNVNEDNIEQVLLDVIEQGARIIFELAPQVMMPSLKVAVEHPEVKILNCSLNESTKQIRTYYARMYEAKFIAGMIAGAMTENDKIAYVADYPIYGMIANINAFALGAAMVNPRAKVYLVWSTKKDYNLERFLEENQIHCVSNQDMITPNSASREYGLYRYENGETISLAAPLSNWGVFYEKMLKSIIDGTYQSEGASEVKALNYWWGMSAEVIDIVCSKNVPGGLLRMVEHLKYDVSNGYIRPFFGEIYSQDGTLRNKNEEDMLPQDIMMMDWLVENVIGDIPSIDEFTECAKPIVELKGVEDSKES